MLGLVSQNANTTGRSPGNPSGDRRAKLEPAPNAANMSEAISEPPVPGELPDDCTFMHDVR